MSANVADHVKAFECDNRPRPALGSAAQRIRSRHPVAAAGDDRLRRSSNRAFAALLLEQWWIARRSGDSNVMAAAVWAPLRVLTAVAINEPIIATLHVARLTSGSRTSSWWPIAAPTDPSRPTTRISPGLLAARPCAVHREVGTVTVIVAEAMVLPRVYLGRRVHPRHAGRADAGRRDRWRRILGRPALAADPSRAEPPCCGFC